MMNLFRRFFSLSGKRRAGARGIFACVFLAFVLFAISYPLPADAWFHTEALGDIGQFFGNAIIKLLQTVFGLLVLAPFVFIVSLINFALSAVVTVLGITMDIVMQFSVNVPYTSLHPALKNVAENPLKLGWETMRDLANMGLLFVLIAIAIGTILQIGATRWRSLFIPFVVIALLINFTPVIAGLVIDLSNILTKVFFDQSTGAWKAFTKILAQDTIGTFFGMLKTIFTDANAMNTILNSFFKAITMLFFQLLLIVTFSTVILVILARILALWLLVILSPLAFVAYILPATRHYFSGWWHNFFQWSIITVPFGFFLWLAALFMAKSGTMCAAGNWGGADGDVLNRLSTAVSSGSQTLTKITENNPFLADVCSSMMLIMAVAILFVGIMVAFSSSAMGSKLIVGAGVAAGAASGAWITKQAYRGGQVAGRVVGGQYEKRVPDSRLKSIGRGIGGAGAKGLGAAGGALGWAAARGEKRLGALGPAGGAFAGGLKQGREAEGPEKALLKIMQAQKESERKKKGEGQKAFEELDKQKLNPTELRRYATMGAEPQRAAANVLLARDDRAFAKKSGAEKQTIYKNAKAAGIDDDLLKHNMPFLSDILAAAPAGSDTAHDLTAQRSKLIDQISKDVKKEMDSMEGLVADDLRAIIEDAKSSAHKRIAATRLLADDHEFDPTRAAPDGTLHQQQAFDIAKDYGQRNKILMRYMHLANPTEIPDVMKEMKKDDYGKMHSEFIKNSAYQHKFMEFYKNIAKPENFGELLKDKGLREGIKHQTIVNMHGLKAGNPSIDQYMASIKRRRSEFKIDSWT